MLQTPACQVSSYFFSRLCCSEHSVVNCTLRKSEDRILFPRCPTLQKNLTSWNRNKNSGVRKLSWCSIKSEQWQFKWAENCFILPPLRRTCLHWRAMQSTAWLCRAGQRTVHATFTGTFFVSHMWYIILILSKISCYVVECVSAGACSFISSPEGSGKRYSCEQLCVGKESILYMNRQRLCNFLVLENLYNSDFHKYRSILVCFTKNMINAAN